jgi:type IV pilus assembly protein PilW
MCVRRGMSLVELMVGIAVGLFIVAAATTLMANQLSDNRKLLVETQIQQDLRATMDIVTRQIRRAGALDVSQAQSGLGTAAGEGGARSTFTTVTPAESASSEVGFAFYRNAGDQGPYGFKLEAGGIKSFSGGGWQELTDVNVMKVTEFTVEPVAPDTKIQLLPCPKPCADGSTACWPQLVVRDYTITIRAEAKADASVRRSMTSRVRLRNDLVRFNPVAAPTTVCPA